MHDLLVIGAGLTGLMAVYTAAQAGLQVKVIAKGLGALHWSAGTIDVLGYHPDEHTPVQYPFRTVQELIEAHPEHPYALLGEQGLADALASFLALTQEIGLPYAGNSIHRRDAEESNRNLCVLGDSAVNMLLPSPVGAARPTFLAPQAQWPGALGGIGMLPHGMPMLIVGFRGMRDFFPGLIAENLSKQGHAARAAFLPLELITDRRDSNTVQLASGLDDPAPRANLAVELKKLVQPEERMGLPAILGLDEHTAVMADLQAKTGATIFEIPTLPPSVPGIRLNTALRRAVERLGVRVEVGMEVVSFHAENGRVAWVETETSGRPLKHRAANFLLATGGILGGGINTDHTGRVWETIFNLPLAVPQQRSEWFRLRFFDPAGHPIFGSGVPVNRQFQPVDANGAPVYANLRAAGGALRVAHADPILERSLEGMAIATGIAAAQHVVHET